MEKSIVQLLKEWVDLTELKIGTYQKYKDASVKSSNKHVDQGDFKAHQSGDETAGEEDFNKSKKRHAGIQRANKLIRREKRKEKSAQKSEPLLKPVEIKSEPSLKQRIIRSMGIK